MSIGNLLICILILETTVSTQSWQQDPVRFGLSRVTSAINIFGARLFKDVAISVNGSVVICPYSLSSSLGILFYGSHGRTQRELSRALGYGAVFLRSKNAARTFYMLSTEHLRSFNPKLYIFEAHSIIIVNQKDSLNPSFKYFAVRFFQTNIMADFDKSSEELVRALNEWVADLTKNKIQHIIESVDPHSDVIVSSVAYFKGIWMRKFPPEETALRVFYNHGSTSNTTRVHMMRMTNVLNFGRFESFAMAELPFKGRNVSMIILLPCLHNGIGELLKGFPYINLQNNLLLMSPTQVDIVLPKFKIKFDADVTENLKSLGIKTLFQPERVDISDMLYSDSVTFGEILHKTQVSVTENGVEAAAAGEPIFSSTTYYKNPDFLADHPFLFVIYETKINMVLFSGLVIEL